jgi:inactivated superfamily I helicase
MTIDSLAASLSSPGDQRAIDGWVAAANAMGQSVEEFFLDSMRAFGKEYATRYNVGVMPGSAFLLRFTDEMGPIMAAAATDPNIAALLEQVCHEPNVAVDDPRVLPGLQYLVSVELLDESRVSEVLAYDRPEPRDFEAEAAMAAAAQLRGPRRGAIE